MILFALGLLFLFVWWLADKHLSEHFLPYLKYSALIFIALFFLVDVFFFIETERFYKAKDIDVRGVAFNYTNASNETATLYVYDIDGIDSGNLVAYHEVEHYTMQLFTGIWPYLAVFVGGTMILQILYIWYANEFFLNNRKPKNDIELKD